MRKFIASILLLCASTLRAQMGPVPGSGGGAVGSGTALTACTSSILYADASSLLKCNPAAVVNGSVSTAGRSILTIRDTITGASATSNFLNVTGTFANSASAAMYGLYFPLTAPSTTGAFPINGIRLSLDYSGAFSETQTAGIVVTNVATNSGGASPFALAVTTEPTSVGIYGSGPYVGAGVYGAVVGGSTGARGAGVIGKVIGNANTANGFGGIFTAQGSTGAGENIGLAAVLAGATSDTQGLATLPATDVALLADNGSVAANIFEARDNGTAVFTIADGGASTFTAPTTFNSGAVIGSNFALSLGGTGYIYGLTGSTPDAPTLATSTTSESWHMTQLADAGQDFNNGACGTGACTDPAFIIHSSVVDTTQYNHLANWGQAGGALKTLTESAATPAVRIPVAALEGTGGKLYYRIKAADATDVAIREGEIKFAVVNKAGTETCTLSGASEAADGSVLAATSASTLTYAITCDTTPTNAVDLSFNAVSSLTQTTLNIQYFVTLTGVGQPARQ